MPPYRIESPAAESPAGRILAYALRRDTRAWPLHAGFALFALFTLHKVFAHVPWRDEAEPWLYFRDHPFFPDLIYATRHQGHPFVWFVCIKLALETGLGFVAASLLNWIFSVAAVALLFYRSALPLLARLAVAFAPILLLELAFTARDYSIAILLCFAAAALYPTARDKPIRFSLVLALLANCNVYSFALFLGISLQFLLEQAFRFGDARFSLRPIFGRYLAANTILLLGALLLVVQLVPSRLPGDVLASSNSLVVPLLSNLERKGFIFLYLPLLALAFFSRGAGRPRIIGGGLIVLLSLGPICCYGVGARHMSMLALGVIYFCWIYREELLAKTCFRGFGLGRSGGPVLVTVLITSVMWGITPLSFSIFTEHYDSRNAAEAIVRQGLDQPGTILVATDPFRVMPILLFLKHVPDDYALPEFGPSPQAYAQDAYERIFVTHCPTATDLKPLILDLAAKNPQKTIVVIDTVASDISDPFAQDPAHRLDLIYRSPFDASLSPLDETYSVYVLRGR